MASSLSVSVEPSQSSFFAGEDFTCRITFTNTNPVVPHTQPLPSSSVFQSPKHASPSRRIVSGSGASAHAKSQSVDVRTFAKQYQQQALRDERSNAFAPGSKSAGLGISNNPNESSTAFAPQGSSQYGSGGSEAHPLPRRRMLIGKGAHPAGPAAEQASQALGANGRPRHSAKAASISALASSSSFSLANTSADSLMPPGDPGSSQSSALGLGRLPNERRSSAASTPATSVNGSRGSVVPSLSEYGLEAVPPSPSPSTPQMSRRPSAPISPAHPHSRKKSVIQTQAQDLSEAFELEHTMRDYPQEDDANRADPTPRSSVDFYNLGRNDTMESVFRDNVTDWSRISGRRGSVGSVGSGGGGRSIGRRKGAPPGLGSSSSPLFPSNKFLPPGTETILWSFAQLGGTFELDESLIKPGDFEDVKRRLAFGNGLASPGVPGTPRAVGGGDLGHETLEDDTGWGSYLRNALSSSSGRAGHRRTVSTLQDTRDRTLQSKTIPTFGTPPSILVVDLSLAPGESRTYSFRIRLPLDLPPSFQGRSIKFTYNLTIGTNRLDPTSRNRQGQKSRLIQIPVRVYNHVSVSGARPFYDLMNPVMYVKDEAFTRCEDEEQGAGVSTVTRRTPVDASEIGQRDLEVYARELLASCAESDAAKERESQAGEVFEDNDSSLSPTKSAPPLVRRLSNAASLLAPEDDLPESCKGAVEVLSRNSPKVSYDISKDGQVAAVLTLVKSTYRLGETVTGVVAINKAGSIARIVRLSATLETHEEVQSSIATMPAARLYKHTKRVHSEHHESSLDLGRANFALAIPSGSTPDFVTSGVKLNWTVRLSFLTVASTRSGPTLKNASANANATNTAAPRLPPPPHLVPTTPDGYGAYHISYRAVPSLAGPLADFTGERVSKGAGGKEANANGYANESKLEVVECSVPIKVLPNSTKFKVGTVHFEA